MSDVRNIDHLADNLIYICGCFPLSMMFLLHRRGPLQSLSNGEKNQLKMESEALDIEFSICTILRMYLYCIGQLLVTCFHHLQIEVSTNSQAL